MNNKNKTAVRLRTFTPTNAYYLQRSPFKVEMLNPLTGFYEGNGRLTEMMYNITRYEQPSSDPELACTALVWNGDLSSSFDLVSLPCHY